MRAKPSGEGNSQSQHSSQTLSPDVDVYKTTPTTLQTRVRISHPHFTAPIPLHSRTSPTSHLHFEQAPPPLTTQLSSLPLREDMPTLKPILQSNVHDLVLRNHIMLQIPPSPPTKLSHHNVAITKHIDIEIDM